MKGYYHAMLRSVFAIALVAACHPAAAPTVARAPATAAVAPTARPNAAPVRQDPAIEDARFQGPLREVIATGHECKQRRPSPIDDRPVPMPPPQMITATPAGCEAHRELPHEPLLH